MIHNTYCKPLAIKAAIKLNYIESRHIHTIQIKTNEPFQHWNKNLLKIN